MKTITIRDFRSRPRQVREALKDEAVLTVSGRPVALMVAVDSSSLEDTARAVRLARGQMALHSIREQARKAGTDSLTETAVEEIIRSARISRKQKERKRER